MSQEEQSPPPPNMVAWNSSLVHKIPVTICKDSHRPTIQDSLSPCHSWGSLKGPGEESGALCSQMGREVILPVSTTVALSALWPPAGPLGHLQSELLFPLTLPSFAILGVVPGTGVEHWSSLYPSSRSS